MTNQKSVLSQRCADRCLYLVGFDRVTFKIRVDRFQFTDAKPNILWRCWYAKMRCRALIRQGFGPEGNLGA